MISICMHKVKDKIMGKKRVSKLKEEHDFVCSPCQANLDEQYHVAGCAKCRDGATDCSWPIGLVRGHWLLHCAKDVQILVFI